MYMQLTQIVHQNKLDVPVVPADGDMEVLPVGMCISINAHSLNSTSVEIKFFEMLPSFSMYIDVVNKIVLIHFF